MKLQHWFNHTPLAVAMVIFITAGVAHSIEEKGKCKDCDDPPAHGGRPFVNSGAQESFFPGIYAKGDIFWSPGYKNDETMGDDDQAPTKTVFTNVYQVGNVTVYEYDRYQYGYPKAASGLNTWFDNNFGECTGVLSDSSGLGVRFSKRAQSEPGGSEYQAPVFSNGLGASESGCGTCTEELPGQFEISVNLGHNGGEDILWKFAGSLASADLMRASFLDSLTPFAGIPGVTVSGNETRRTVTISDTLSAPRGSPLNLVSAALFIYTADGSGGIESLTIQVTSAASPSQLVIHSFERVEALLPGGMTLEGVQYQHEVPGRPVEIVSFYNSGTNGSVAGSNAIQGVFRKINTRGDQETLIAPPETTNTFPWVSAPGHPNGGYYGGTLTETLEVDPATPGEPTVTTTRTYAKIGNAAKNQRVLVAETVLVGADSTHTVHGFDERTTITVTDGNGSSVATSNPKFGRQVWEAHSDGTWRLSLLKEVTTPALKFADEVEFTLWADGPAHYANPTDIAATKSFFATKIAEAQTGSLYVIANCRRVLLTSKNDQNLNVGWTRRRETSIGSQKIGVEYDYDFGQVGSINLPVGSTNLKLISRHERWNASAAMASAPATDWTVAGAASTWRATYRSGASMSLELDESGLARMNIESILANGTRNDSSTFAISYSGTVPAYDAIRSPRSHMTSSNLSLVRHPLWRREDRDTNDRTTYEQSFHRAVGSNTDALIQAITTTYSGKTSSARAAGTTLLASHAEDVVAEVGGVSQRTSTSTDAQGIVTVTVTDKATGELVSETKKGVAAAGTLAAQPDLTTNYATSTNATTGVTTRTVTQTDGTTTRTLSVTVSDAQGRMTSVTDEIGRVTTTSYSSDGRTTTETLPGGLTRITETHLDGQLRRVYGTAVTPEYHTYTVNDGGTAGYEAGSITEATYFNDDGTGGTRSAHWRTSTSNYLGQVLREEQPSPASGGGVTVTQHFYNAKGQRVKTTRSCTADQLAAYDVFGRVVKAGYDVDGDGALEAVSTDVLTETEVSYEQVSGAWVEKVLQRTHTLADGTGAQETVTRRRLAEGDAWQSSTAADGSVTVFESGSDAEDHLRVETVSRSAPGVGTLTAVQVSTYYNELLAAQSVPDASAALTFAYNGFGQMTSQVHPVNGTSTWTYDSATGQPLTQTTAGSSTVTTSYYGSSHANAGQPASITANGEVTHYAYDSQGRTTHQWGTGSQPLKYVYDGLGRLHELHTYQGGTGWDGGTLPSAFSSATAAVTTWDYHPGTSALWKKTDAAGEFVKYAYDSAHSGPLSVKTNARGITTTHSYAQTSGGKKLPGRVSGKNYGDSTPDVGMTYLRSGEVASVTDAAGVSTFARSGATRTTTVTGSGLMTDLVLTRTEFGPDMPETVQAQVGSSTVVLNQHQWHGSGSLAKAWQGDRTTGAGGGGIRQVWNRNAATGRLESISTEALGSGATHGVTRSYTHASGGRVQRLWYNAGPLGSAPTTSVQGFEYAHDTHGRRETAAPYLPDNAPAAADQPPGWKYGYNERGEVTLADRFTAVGGPSTGVVTHQRRSYDYDLMGNRNTATQGTNVGELNETGYTANILQQYDGITHTRLVEITGQAVAAATVELTLDGGTPVTINRSLAAHQTGDPDSFRYVHTMGGTDARLLHVSIKASAGGIDITRAGFTYVPPSSETLEYDEDGNLTETAEWDYTWDAENRLIVAEQKSLPVAGGFTAPALKKLEFAYDAQNHRIAKVVREWKTVGGVPQWVLAKDLRFVYDGWQMIAELDHTFATGAALAGSAVNRTFLWGPDLSGTMTGAGGVGGLLCTTYQGDTYQVCGDANGNVTGLVPANGTEAGSLTVRFDYDPFGRRVSSEGPRVTLCPFGFSSKYLEDESEINAYELRSYISELGRWINRDPPDEKGGLNLYKICKNDLLNNVDLLGLRPRENPGNPKVFWHDWSVLRRDSWFKEFKFQYGRDIEKSAKLNCVPKELLAAIIANEMIDYSDDEKFQEETLGIGKSVGPGQITAATMKREGITDGGQRLYS